MNMVVLDGYTENPGDISWGPLERLGELKVYDRTAEQEATERIGTAEIVFTNKTPVSKETISRCSRLKYIGVLATGYNVVDVKAAMEAGIVVTNIPSYGTDAVAQYVMALLLEVCHHVGIHSELVKKGRWSACKDWCFWEYPLMELAGKTMGIIGFGRIGKRVAELAVSFGMNVLACNESEVASEIPNCRCVKLEEVLNNSDVISLNCPLLPSTKEMINRETISRMKDGVIIINTARGQLIAENDLREALESGKVGAAAVDVVSEEPIHRDNPLLAAPRMIITPHIAWASRESRQRLMNIAADNLESFLKGSPKNLVLPF